MVINSYGPIIVNILKPNYLYQKFSLTVEIVLSASLSIIKKRI